MEIERVSRFRGAAARRLPTLDTIEIIEAVLLSLATVLTAWSAFQAAVWDGDQSAKFAQSEALHSQSVRAVNVATVQSNIDTVLFDRWLAAEDSHDSTTTAAIEGTMRPALRAALHAWETDGGITEKAGAPSSPLQEGSYLNADLSAADAYTRQADAAVKEADHANETSDYYILATVVVALVLFLVGIASKLHSREVRFGLAAFASICLATSVIVIVLLPATWP